MNSEIVKYFLSMSDKMNEDVFIFYVFSSGKKRISSEFSPFERSLSFEGLLSPLERFLSDVRLLLFNFYPFGG